MTLKSLRPLLAVVPVLIAVGIVAACGPYPQPAGSTPPATGSPACTPLPPPPQPQVYYYPAPIPPPLQSPMPAAWNLSVVNGKLQIQTADGSRSLCERLTILVSGVEDVEAIVAGNRIQISSGKDAPGSIFLQASADRVTRTGQEGSIVAFEGNAKMVYARNGKKADVSADRVSVNLMTGQVVTEMDAPQQVTPIMPCGESRPCTPAPVMPLTSASPSLGVAVGENCILR